MRFLCALFSLLLLFFHARAHVALDYPPPVSRLDFLDNVRTQSLCGMTASGVDGSHLWRVPPLTALDTTTELQAGSLLNATWNLHYPHQGGWRFQLFDAEGEVVATWDDAEHWDCNYDGTQQWAELRLPTVQCNDCVLRLERQALEWGASYTFLSCARVNIVSSNPCNGCSGNGDCIQGKCVCHNDVLRGFWEGTYCERQNECQQDSQCGAGGVCIDTQATTPPRMQCYCKTGWFGKETQPWMPRSALPVRRCEKRSSLKIDDVEDWGVEYTNKRSSSPSGAFELYYKVEEGFLEVAIKAETRGWVGFGVRPVSQKGGGPLETYSEPESQPGSEAEAVGESEGVSEAESEGETGNRANACPEGAVRAELDEGSFPAAAGEPAATAKRRLNQLPFPPLLSEAEMKDPSVEPLWIFEGRSLRQEVDVSEAEGAPEGESEPDAEPAHSESEAETEAVVRGDPVHLHPDLLPEASAPPNAFVGEGECRMPLTADSSAHPMINQDIVVGYAHGDAYRIQDSYTPSRARPLPDAMFGGNDDILDAIGYEADGYTFLKFRRPLQVSDSATDYCLLPEVNYLMIYAFGQSAEEYSHVPPSSLEVLKAQNSAFYGDDELKYHGGGIGVSYENRGSFGVVNFFEQPTQSACLPSTLSGYDCMKAAISSALTLHWSVQDREVRFAAEARSQGWVAVAWTETPGQMIGSTAVIGSSSNVGVYELRAKAVSGVVSADNGFQISQVAFSRSERTTLEFTRAFDESFHKEASQDLILAYHTDDALGYHGPNRAALQVSLDSLSTESMLTPDAPTRLFDNAAASTSCAVSELEELECSKEVMPDVVLHWKLGTDSASFAVEAPGSGWVALAWPENPGSMVPSHAVIGSALSDVGSYRIEGKTVEDIVPDAFLFRLSDARVVTANGRLRLQFARALDRDFDGSGKIDLLVAYHPDSADLGYHGFANRAAISLNLRTGAASVEYTMNDNASFLDAHAILMSVGWGMLIPLGVVVARTLKDKDPLWFRLHKTLQVTGIAAAIAGFVIATLKFDAEDDFRHRQVGLAVMVLGVAQPLNAVIRPHHGAFLRRPWEWMHLTVGRAAVVLALYNIYTGMERYEVLRNVGSKKWQFRFGMWLLAIALLYLLLESRAQGIRSREKRKEEAAIAKEQTEASTTAEGDTV